MEKANSGRVFVNAEALRIAAENKSYQAFERMLEISAADSHGVPGSKDIGLGEHWNKVQEIGQSDERIASALAKYEKDADATFNAFMDEFFPEDQEDEAEPKQENPSLWRRMLNATAPR